MKTTKDLTQELTKIDEPSQAIVLYKITPAEIAKQLKKYDALKVIEADTASYKQVRVALTSLVATRVEVDKRRKQLGEKARNLVTNINIAGKMLIEPMTPYEDRFRAELKVEDDRKDAIKAEKEAKERKRIEAIQEKINSIRTLGVVHSGISMPNVTSSAIQDRLTLTRGIEISDEIYQEFTDQAMDAQMTAITTLEEILTDRLQFEKDETARKTEAERLEAQRKEQEAAQVKIDEENRKIEEKRKDIERGEFEREAEKRAEKLAQEKVEREACERLEKEEAEAKEKARQEALKPDRDKIYDYANALMDICTAQVKSDEAREILAWASNETEKLANKVREQAEKL